MPTIRSLRSLLPAIALAIAAPLSAQAPTLVNAASAQSRIVTTATEEVEIGRASCRERVFVGV